MTHNWRGPHTKPSKEIQFIDALIQTGKEFWLFLRMMVVLALIGACIVGFISLFAG